jgi:hypothetical protein
MGSGAEEEPRQCARWGGASGCAGAGARMRTSGGMRVASLGNSGRLQRHGDGRYATAAIPRRVTRHRAARITAQRSDFCTDEGSSVVRRSPTALSRGPDAASRLIATPESARPTGTTRAPARRSERRALEAEPTARHRRVARTHRHPARPATPTGVVAEQRPTAPRSRRATRPITPTRRAAAPDLDEHHRCYSSIPSRATGGPGRRTRERACQALRRRTAASPVAAGRPGRPERQVVLDDVLVSVPVRRAG